MSSSKDIVTLDVGGHVYRTTITTLTRYPDSMLGAMFSGDLGTLQDDQGRYFIDRDGTLFRHVLNFLRTSQLVLPEDFKELPLLEMEADFYQIQSLIEAVKSYKTSIDQPCAQDVVSFTFVPPYIITVGANIKEVEDMVRVMVQTVSSQLYTSHQIPGNVNLPPDTYVASLLGRLNEIGFTTVQIFGVYNPQRYVTEKTWIMVRKTSGNS
ncbi:KCTD21 [Branchiostoma lanceolatum]|uniref:KCTD21 protein n=1 Tax=Branchiostoma lanceolatum TaxID=7740 RepID=A0A8J9VMD2_BRALA|nr:KCTD21 [Branchiostoma lanceolatum]